MVEFPQGLTREGENLELTCLSKGKPQYGSHTTQHMISCQSGYCHVSDGLQWRPWF